MPTRYVSGPRSWYEDHKLSLKPSLGELVPRSPDRFAPYTGANSYVGPMIDKGYAVAYTRRSAARGPGDDEQAELHDGHARIDCEAVTGRGVIAAVSDETAPTTGTPI